NACRSRWAGRPRWQPGATRAILKRRSCLRWNPIMRVLIVDDEAPARLRLRGLQQQIPGVVVAGEAGDGASARKQFDAPGTDIVLLDIRMPGMDGLECARHLAGLATPPAVIFTTAYDRFAIEAFEAQAVDYLVKPVRRERLEAALSRASRPNAAQRA